jgi:hypothetical protein
MATPPHPGQLRLAELVAALSLGIDLGFGQPMEHVLRQCLIALRLADRIGADEPSRVAVYYTALLNNVGCHSDAYEQAKWFGDDIALKSGKYRRSSSGVAGAAAMLRLVGAGNPPLRRIRVGLQLLMSGGRDVDSMIASHAKLAQRLASQLKLPAAVVAAVGSAYEQWDGHGWPGMLARDAIPLASRIARVAEYVEVAHRMGGNAAAVGKQFDPKLTGLIVRDAGAIFGGLDSAGTWDAVVNAEPALAVVSRRRSSMRRCWRSPTSSI